MSQATSLSISLPSDLRAGLDAEAGRQRRSRSFVVAEAVREYLDRREQRAFDQARDRTLREGLALSPAERLRLSEELWRELVRGREPAAGWTAAFDTSRSMSTGAGAERWPAERRTSVASRSRCMGRFAPPRTSTC
jgi:predicted transcriptional regulator